MAKSVKERTKQVERMQKEVQSMSGNRQKFVTSMSENGINALELVLQKTKDYATIDDPYRNFRLCESVGIPLEKGILVRMCDKLSRIGNLIENNDPSVKSESIEDTLIDIMNYANILLCYIQQKNS